MEAALPTTQDATAPRVPGDGQPASARGAFADDAFMEQHTLSFVSPHAFGDHARRVKVTLDNYEVEK
jgi:hypothetical protein